MDDAIPPSRGWFWKAQLRFLFGGVVFFAYELLIVFPLIVWLVDKSYISSGDELAALFISLSGGGWFCLHALWESTGTGQSAAQRRADDFALHEWFARQFSPWTRNMGAVELSSRLRRANVVAVGAIAITTAPLPLAILAGHFEWGLGVLFAWAVLGGIWTWLVPVRAPAA